MNDVFTGNFTQQEPLPDEAISAAVAVMSHGRLHRYNVAEGEVSETALLEQEFAQYTGARYALAVASGGYALATALRALGVTPGSKVLTNAFTLAPVPGAIAAVGARPVFVGVTKGLVIDLDDLETKTSEASVLLLSHMRGHICDMDRLMRICDQNGIKVVEDCAHTMGATWRGVPSGRHGVIGCYSTQTYKHINSGEGGLLITDSDSIMARATILSGSYMLYDRHGTPAPRDVIDDIKYHTPNMSGRMDNLRAAILRPQLRDLPAQIDRWNARYRVVEACLQNTSGLTIIPRVADEKYVGSSIQFLLLDWPKNGIRQVIERCAARGVELKWFGNKEPTGFTSRYDSWRYAPSERMANTDHILCGIIDMRLPLTFSLEDCALIGGIIRQEVENIWQIMAVNGRG